MSDRIALTRGIGLTRGIRGWLIGLALIVVVSSAVAVWLVWWTTDLQIQVNTFYNGTIGGEVLEDDVYRYWDTLSARAYALQGLAPPLLLAALGAVFTMLAVLARRWDRAH